MHKLLRQQGAVMQTGGSPVLISYLSVALFSHCISYEHIAVLLQHFCSCVNNVGLHINGTTVAYHDSQS